MSKIPPSGDRKFIQGDTRTIQIDVTDNDGNRKDLSGGSATFEVFDGNTSVFQKTKSGGGIVFTSTEGDSVNDRQEITVDPADTSGLSIVGKKVYSYESQITDSSGDISTVADGEFGPIHEEKIS